MPPAPSALDLHSHTNRSDGVLEPDRLVAEAAGAGVRLLAITDHDTLAGFRALGPLPPGIEVIPGVEINSVAVGIAGLREGELHILGLGVDPADEAFDVLLARQRALRAERVGRIAERLDGLGLPIRDALIAEERAEGASIGRPHLARALVRAGHARSVDDAMTRFLAPGRPAYEPRVGIGPRAAVEAIRAAGGLAAIAHFAEAPAQRPLIRELMEVGLGGLEVHYARFSADEVAGVDAVASELGLVATGGSDHHGHDDTYAESHAMLWVPPHAEMPLREGLARAAAGA